ncbi:MAG TPA: GNAT family N-acetyltransferase [Geminicoccus sp.]|uniref:GNAT family N-acetyltransferase n=1 Tax=Geminicoccus sp. TaxID=2024832 RepID=UPI002E33E792|nr:GNAT family N-acetyltransferase [Geminicoccus sp.]HEX2526285.1 GNAT family N-acetyltransferase [Geminicoccus sp.]
MLEFRHATEFDLPAIVAMLADDEFGRERERYKEPLPRAYHEAFRAIQRQEGNSVIVALEEGVIVGCLQLTLIPRLGRGGALRALIEGVRVHRSRRGRGIGQAIMHEAIGRAREAGCRLVQLTTDKRRGDAHRFYARLGFVASHVGMKLDIS